MVKCPYCGKPAMSLARKSGLGPGRMIPCQSCGKPVMTHSLAVFAAIPAFLAPIVYDRWGGSGTFLCAGVAVAVLGLGAWWMHRAPVDDAALQPIG